MTIPSALPTDSEPTHHLTLETIDGYTKIGLFGCDNRAQRNDRAMVRTPLVRSGIKISQGASEHSDLLPPFSEVEQSTWIGGLGLLDMKDRERYYHGENLDTSHESKAFLGPMPQPFPIGLRNSDESMWGSCQWADLYSGTRRQARRFLTTAAYNADHIGLFLRCLGKPQNLTVRLLSDTAGDPGATLQTVTQAPLGIPYAYGVYVKFDWAGVQALANATTYWVEVEASASDDVSNHWILLVTGSTTYDDFVAPVGTSISGRKPPIRLLNRRGVTGSALQDPPIWFLAGTDAFGVIALPDVPMPPAGYGFEGSAGTASELHMGKLTAGSGYTFALVDGWIIAVKVEANLRPFSGSTVLGLIIAYVDTSNWVAAFADSTTLYLRKNVGGTITDVASVAYAWSGTHLLSVRRFQLSNYYTIAVDGVDQVSGTITEHATSTVHGIACYGSYLHQTQAMDFRVTSVSNTKRWTGAAWVTAESNMRFRVLDTPRLFKAIPFSYKGGTYFIKDYEDGGTPQLYSCNSERGVATGAQTSTTLQDTTAAFGTNGRVGAILKLTGGTGKGQWRMIASNTATILTIDGKPWKTTPVAGSTEYVICGVGWSSEITGMGLTGPVTDVLVSSKDVIYIAQGDAVNIRRLRFYNSAGAWTYQAADDGNNRATFLEEWADEDRGFRIAKANQVDGAGELSCAKANTTAWGTDLVFETAIVVGRRAEMITNLIRYGDPEKVWVLKEGGFGRLLTDLFSQAPLREIETAASELNGATALVHNLYLYTSFGRGGFERYYQDRLDDMGPNKDDGPPYTTAGPIAAALGYPGRFFAATGEFNWPSDKLAGIYKYNGQGWHPYYTHYELGVAINALWIEVVPGATPDRLYFSAGGEVVFLDLPSERIDPTSDDAISYHFQGYMETSWNYFDYRDATKFFDKLKVSADYLMSGFRFIQVMYNVDDGTGWHSLKSNYVTSPTQTIELSSNDGHRSGVLQGRRVKMVVVLNSADRYSTPVLRALVTAGVVFQDTKYRLDMTFKLADEMVDLEGDEEQMVVNGVTYTSPTVEQKAALLEGLANTGTVMKMRCILSPFDNKTVAIDPESLNPWNVIPDEQVETHVGKIGFVELR